MHSPLVDSSVDNVSLYQSLFQFIDIPKQHPMNSLLQNAVKMVPRGYIIIRIRVGIRNYTDVFVLYFNSCNICTVLSSNSETDIR